MHIAFFSDQHPATLGGLQVSLGLQRQFLEAAGHTVTICAPDIKHQRSPHFSRPRDVILPSIRWGEHSFCFPGSHMDSLVEEGFASLPPVDVVHVQADVWGAWNGYRFARHHSLPVAHTMHTNIELGLPANVPFPRAAFRLLYSMQQRHMRTGLVRNMSDYLQSFAYSADSLIVPTSHFAEHLRTYGINRTPHVIPTGIDDTTTTRLLSEQRQPHQRPLLVWPGRISKEKRLDDLLRAFARAQIDAQVDIYGSGPAMAECQALATELGIDSDVTFRGAVSHDEVLRAMRHADVVLQSSLGFETQGLTMYEAIAVGTPVLVRDPSIAGELPVDWSHRVTDASVASLAHALRELPTMLDGGRFSALGPAPADFSQRALTGRLLDIYRDLRAGVAGNVRIEEAVPTAA